MLETYQSHSQHLIQIVIELLYLQVWLYVQAQGQLNIVLALRYNRVGRLFIAAVSELYPPAAATLRRVKQHGFLLNLAKLLKRTFWRRTGNVGQFVPRPQTQDRPECSQSRLGQVSSLCKLHCCLMLYHEWLTRVLWVFWTRDNMDTDMWGNAALSKQCQIVWKYLSAAS